MCAFVTTLFKSCKITSDFVVIFSLVCGCVVFFFFFEKHSWRKLICSLQAKLFKIDRFSNVVPQKSFERCFF